eukprot:CAMPEP_0172700732 /NCGR_PEP_ID=MMETSP1074-20121228/31118_1 /TAXON_ID=2916 /ORGANISM="Ceratium fusus, Strain PA161109" /LENGTH=575 /DNA_ID=CAMNT_0013522167 /DNA_START=51 /DNA_END=1774 /DNA_ORIENTATION=-
MMQMKTWQQLFLFTLCVLHLQLHVATGTMVMRAGKIGATPANKTSGGSCASLGNRGAYFDIEVEVGTPGQKFAVVADTGSNSLIVPSCVCHQLGYCSPDSRCFIGANHSSTYLLMRDANGKARYVMIRFGSGIVQGAIAHESVRIGQTTADMKDGVVLMTQKVLRFPGHFEGVLGLGIPYTRPMAPQDKKKKESAVDEVIKSLEKVLGKSGESLLSLPSSLKANMSAALGGPYPSGFMEQSDVNRFSVCFNRVTDGVLRLDPMPLPVLMPTLALQHWSVALNGVSIGNSKRKVTICAPSQKQLFPATPCAAIPDSGTTLILAPSAHIKLLAEDLCDAWPRCKQNHTALKRAIDAATKAAKKVYGFNPFRWPTPSKLRVLETVLNDCSSWLDEGSGGLAAELPDIKFSIAGKDGTSTTELKLPPRAYVFQRNVRERVATLVEQVEETESSIEDDSAAFGAKLSSGSSSVSAAESAVQRKQCSLAFGVANYFTRENGPAWILGSPFFYEFDVGFDLSSKPPALSFRQLTDDAPCGACAAGGSLATASNPTDGAADSHQLPHWTSGPPRMPTFASDEP